MSFDTEEQRNTKQSTETHIDVPGNNDSHVREKISVLLDF